jgi:HlyD family secretion protein
MKRKIFWSGIILIIVSAGLFILIQSNSTAATTTFQMAEITRGDIINMVSCSGSLEAVGTVEVGTQVSGVLDRIYVDFNDKVKKNQILAVLDTVMLKTQVMDAEANYEKASVQLEEAQANYDRNILLFKDGLISDAEFLPFKITLKSQQAGVKSAEAAVVRAKRNLKYAVIRSPINGTIIQRNVEEGQTVAASLQAPTLFIIAEDLSRMEIHAQVDESDIGQIKEGQKAVFEVQAYPDRKFEGQVRQVRLQPEVIQNVVNYTVIVDAKNEEDLLLPGMTATIDFYVEEKHDVLLVPNSALRFQPSEEMLTEFRNRKRQQFDNNSDSTRQSSALRVNWSRRTDLKSGTMQNSGKVWFINSQGKLDMSPFVPGSTDGKVTEIAHSRNLKQGMQVISGWSDEKQAAENGDSRRGGMRRLRIF